MSEFRFAFPVALLILVVPLVIYYQPILRRFWPLAPVTLRYSDVRLMRGIPANWRVRFRWLPDVLRWVGWALLVIALARPQGGRIEQTLRGSGIDIVLAVDISNSMAAVDFMPQNRLEAAKSVIGEFIGRREFDRIGLVVFARDAFHQCPLTLDYPVLLNLLGEVQLVEDIVSSSTASENAADGERLLMDGTAIGLGIASAANMLRSSDAASKVIIILTDGDNNAALDPLEASAAASALGIRVYTIGMGRTGIVQRPDENGILEPMNSQLDEAALQNIAAAANGLYLRAEDRAGLEQVYRQIDSLERSEIERRIVIRWQDQAAFVLVPAFVLLLIERLLRRTLFQTIP